MKTARNGRFSLIAPMYNEAEALDAFFGTVLPMLEALGAIDWEIIAVDDGSQDDTFTRLLDWRRREPRLKVARLSRNFGKEAALTAGLRLARGDAVACIDADLQDDPAAIPPMFEKWRDGFDVAVGVRADRSSDFFLKRWTSRVFYKIFNAISDRRLDEGAGDFRLLDRKAVNAMLLLGERARFMKGLFGWIGFRTARVEYTRGPRSKGKTKWSPWGLFRLSLDGFFSFSMAPLRWMAVAGLFISLLAMARGAQLFARTLFYGVDVPGYASTIVALLWLGGTQLLSLGVLGEYVGRILMEAKARPLYLLDEMTGFDDAAFSPPAAACRPLPAADACSDIRACPDIPGSLREQ